MRWLILFALIKSTLITAQVTEFKYSWINNHKGHYVFHLSQIDSLKWDSLKVERKLFSRKLKKFIKNSGYVQISRDDSNLWNKYSARLKKGKTLDTLLISEIVVDYSLKRVHMVYVYGFPMSYEGNESLVYVSKSFKWKRFEKTRKIPLKSPYGLQSADLNLIIEDWESVIFILLNEKFRLTAARYEFGLNILN